MNTNKKYILTKEVALIEVCIDKLQRSKDANRPIKIDDFVYLLETLKNVNKSLYDISLSLSMKEVNEAKKLMLEQFGL